jgi:hypothetical protein
LHYHEEGRVEWMRSANIKVRIADLFVLFSFRPACAQNSGVTTHHASLSLQLNIALFLTEAAIAVEGVTMRAAVASAVALALAIW